MLRKMLVASVLALGAAGAAHAQSITIDDFATGPVLLQFPGANQKADFDKFVTLHGSGIYGNIRKVYLQLPLVGNPFGQNLALQIKPAKSGLPAGMYTGAGFQTQYRVDVSYGYSQDPKQQLHNLDLTGNDRFRLTFAGMNGSIDFVFEVWSNINGTFTGQAWNCDLPPSTQSLYPATEFTLDLPFSAIGGPVDWKHVRSIYVVLQSAGQGGQDFGLEKIEAVSGGQASIACGVNGPLPPYALK